MRHQFLYQFIHHCILFKGKGSILFKGEGSCFPVPRYPCHTQSVERCVKLVTMLSSRCLESIGCTVWNKGWNPAKYCQALTPKNNSLSFCLIDLLMNKLLTLIQCERNVINVTFYLINCNWGIIELSQCVNIT